MTNQIKLPKFKGQPLIEIPKEIPQIGFLEGAFGQAVFNEYQGRVKSDYSNNPNLNTLSYKDDVVRGSNPFAVALVNKIVSEEGLRVANQADLERALRLDVGLQLNGHYEDTGLVLRGTTEPNSYLAIDLMNQVKAINPNPKTPIMIPLSEVDLKNDSKSNYGLAFRLNEDAQIFYDLSILNQDGRFSSEDIDHETGLPTKLNKNGDRQLWSRNSGLSRLYLDRVLGLYSVVDGLADSNGYGRVVVVGAEGTATDLKQHLANLEQEKAKQIQEIEARYTKAHKILLGK